MREGERDREEVKDTEREKERDRERKREGERERETDRKRERERTERDKERERERDREREREREQERERETERERGAREREREREQKRERECTQQLLPQPDTATWQRKRPLCSTARLCHVAQGLTALAKDISHKTLYMRLHPLNGVKRKELLAVSHEAITVAALPGLVTTDKLLLADFPNHDDTLP